MLTLVRNSTAPPTEVDEEEATVQTIVVGLTVAHQTSLEDLQVLEDEFQVQKSEESTESSNKFDVSRMNQSSSIPRENSGQAPINSDTGNSMPTQRGLRKRASVWLGEVSSEFYPRSAALESASTTEAQYNIVSNPEVAINIAQAISLRCAAPVHNINVPRVTVLEKAP